MKEKFTMTIPCKFYVANYLINNGGNPVDLSVFPDLYYIFKNKLTREHINEKRKPQIAKPATVTVIIPNDWFYRYGFNLSTEDAKEFVLKAEMQLKQKMRQYVLMKRSFGNSIASAIRDFQEEFALYEPVWPFESIKKDYDRHVSPEKGRVLKDIRTQFLDRFYEEIYTLN